MKALQIRKILLVVLVISGFGSCKKDFDQKPQTELDVTQMYRNVYDANAAVMGIYGKFMGMADRYIIMNELRGDLLEYTDNADQYLRQLSTHTVTADNPYANPRPFYELILNCNDVLKHFDIMKQNNTLKEVDYNQRYSDIACLRAFLYLQLGIHYGDEVRYVTDPLENVTDVNDESRFPKLTFDALLDTLVNSTERLPFKEIYPVDVSNGVGTSLNITLDAYPTSTLFINKKCLLGELYLWKGNYRKAASYYREVMEFASASTNDETRYCQYKMTYSTNTVTYTKPGDTTTLVYNDGWAGMFSLTGINYTWEMLWALPYDNKFAPANPLINLFSPIGGSYLVKPSQAIINNWNRQTQGGLAVNSGLSVGTGGIPFDSRRLLSVRNIGGQPVVMKFLYNYLNPNTAIPVNPLVKNGKWFVYREAQLHLHFAEAANRDGFPRLAYAMFNNGIPNVYNNTALADKTTVMNTFGYPDPYKFDARNGEIPRWRAPWYRNTGVRSRANLTTYVMTPGIDSVTEVENGLINEGALETAFEGSRWPDLIRIARRRNDPSFLADKIWDKLVADRVGNAAAIRAKLMDRKNWYLPFNLK